MRQRKLENQTKKRTAMPKSVEARDLSHAISVVSVVGSDLRRLPTGAWSEKSRTAITKATTNAVPLSATQRTP